MAVRDNVNGGSGGSGGIEVITVSCGYECIDQGVANSVSVSGNVLSVTFYKTNNAYAEAYFATKDMFDLTDTTFLLMTRASQTNSTLGQYGKIFLVDENGTRTQIASQHIPNEFTYLNYVDVSEYTGKYKICFTVNTAVYVTGYGNATGSLTINDLKLTGISSNSVLVNGSKLDMIITTVSSDYLYTAIPKTKGKLYAQYVSNNAATLTVYGIPSIESTERTQISTFTLSTDSTAKVEIDFGDYDYISIQHKAISGQGSFRLIEE